MRTDVIVKTHWADLSYCSYALRFLAKNWKEPQSNIIVLANSDCRPVIEQWGFPKDRFKYFYVDPWPDGNQFQTYLTLLYDHFSDADLFAVFDSDTMLLKPFTVSDRCLEGKPIIYFEPKDDSLSEDRVIAHRLWFPIMEYWVGEKPKADYMFAFPFVYWADTIRAVRRLITAKTGKGVLEALYSAVPFDPAKFLTHPFRFCEHNVISFYAAVHEADRYAFRDINEVTDIERAHWPVKQYHSWSGFSAERQNEFEAMLSQ